MRCLLRFAQSHTDFRLPELEALTEITQVPVEYDSSSYDRSTPFLEFTTPSAKHVKRLISRAVLVRDCIELWTTGSSLDELLANVQRDTQHYWPKYMQSSFKFIVDSFGQSYSAQKQRDIINRFAFLPFQGKIDLKNPNVEFCVFHDSGIDVDAPGHHDHMGGYAVVRPEKYYFGRLISRSTGRDTIDKFDLKKRRYIGNTSMDAELSLIMANMALARPGSFMYDPFAGTCSFLITCAHYGAATFGSDIDGRQIRGTAGHAGGQGGGLAANVVQYDVKDRVMGAACFDVCQNPWRQPPEGLFDAIVTDPPYGVRAGARRIGVLDANAPDGATGSAERIPKAKGLPITVAYEMGDIISDLTSFGVKYLVPGGRLCFWLPTITEGYSASDVPVPPGMRIVANSEQKFGKWSRRLVTMEKLHGDHHSVDGKGSSSPKPIVPGHGFFRDRYFTGSLPSSVSPSPALPSK
ncbi:tRNA guanosine-2'-O-methyltransferase [Ramicandelaber brevisporus]|nr:tRNA guanosine-2'-O-methyltransferase [Ramicandelaber brevisporus]